MTDTEPPEGAPTPQEPPADATGEPEPAPQEPSADASGEPEPAPQESRLGLPPVLEPGGPPFRFIPPAPLPPVISPIETPVLEPPNPATGAGQGSVLQVGPAPGPVFVALGDQAAQAAITRDNFQIPVIPIDPGQLGNVHLVPPVFSQRVVSQSIPPGTRVPQGTTVDLVLAPPTILPMNIVPGVHQGFLGTPAGSTTPFTLATVYTQFIQNNAELQGVLGRNTTAPSPSSADGQAIVSALSGLTPPVQATAGDVAAAFAGLQAAMTFGG